MIRNILDYRFMLTYLYSDLSDEKYDWREIRWCCNQGGLLNIHHSNFFDLTALMKRPPNMWRYKEAMALPNEINYISLGEMMTPYIPIEIENREIWVKVDYLFPSGSYKDRGAAVLMSLAAHLGVKRVVQDSSGNAGCAIAQYSAKAGIHCDIYVPADTSESKLVQMRKCGAQVHAIPGPREASAQAAQKAAAKSFYASHVWNPFFLEGMKTFAFEIWEQAGERFPHTLILPAGNGTLLLGAFMGMSELFKQNLIPFIPKLIGVQAANCAPLFDLFNRYPYRKSVNENSTYFSGNPRANLSFVAAGKTMAEGIAIAEPKRATQMLSAIQQTGGQVLAVQEHEIISAWKILTAKGYYVEPTSAAVIAGVIQYINEHAEKDERISSVLTGHGLKASQKISTL